MCRHPASNFFFLPEKAKLSVLISPAVLGKRQKPKQTQCPTTDDFNYLLKGKFANALL